MGLALFYLVAHQNLLAQKHTIEKLCDVKPGQKVLNFEARNGFNKNFSYVTESQVLVTIEEKNNYRCLLNKKDFGLLPKGMDIKPSLDKDGNLILPFTRGLRQFILANNKQYGPFTEVESAEFENGELVIQEDNERNKYWTIGSDTILTSEFYTIFHTDKANKYWAIIPNSKNPYLTNLVINDSIYEKNKVFPYYDSKGDGWFAYFYEPSNPLSGHHENEPLYYYLNGKKGGPIESYWASIFDNHGHFFGRHQLNNEWYIQYDDELHGPYTRLPNNLNFISNDSDIIFSHPTDTTNTDFAIYYNWNKIGEYSDVMLFGSDRGFSESDLLYSYNDGGKQKIGFQGKAIDTNVSAIQIAFKKQQNIIYSDGSKVFLNKKLLNEYDRVINVSVSEDGKPLVIFYNSDGYGFNFNGEHVIFDAHIYPNSIISKDSKHFLAYDFYEADFYMVDGKKYPCKKGQISFYYNPNSNSFHCLQLDGNELNWHNFSFE